MIAFSEAMCENDRALKTFLRSHMYRHAHVVTRTEKAKVIVRTLFGVFLADPDRMPEVWAAHARGLDETARARVVADYIAGMTDRYAIEEVTRIKGKHPAI